jgi:quercetin dioxygenase-like cupin family protein
VIDPRTNPRHAHDFPHLVKIEVGTGVLTDEKGLDHPIQKSDFVYIKDNEVHNFKNTGAEPFDFIRRSSQAVLW